MYSDNAFVVALHLPAPRQPSQHPPPPPAASSPKQLDLTSNALARQPQIPRLTGRHAAAAALNWLRNHTTLVPAGARCLLCPIHGQLSHALTQRAPLLPRLGVGP